MDTTSVKKQGGDYSISELAERNSAIELSGHLIDSYRRHADGLQAIVFAINVEHSKAIADRYNQAGIAAAHLDGRTPDKVRAETIAAFRRGEIRVLANCNLFDEGFDLPSLGCVQIARPTQSLGKYLQMLGRGARPEKGKDCAIYIDHTQNYLIHGLPDADREWSLDGVKSDLRPIGIDSDGRVESLTEDKAEREEKAIVELEYVVLERVGKIQFPAEVVEMYRNEPSLKKLAKQIGCSPTSLSNYLKSIGVDVVFSRRDKVTFPADTVERYTARPSVPQLAKELGCGKSTLARYLKSKGIETGKVIPDGVVERYKAGDSVQKISKDVGCGRKWVRRCLVVEGIEITNRAARKAFPDDIVEQYYQAGSVSKLAKLVPCCPSALSKHLRSLGIDTSKKPKSSHEGSSQ
jgi:AraC-like DNA-binding protein